MKVFATPADRRRSLSILGGVLAGFLVLYFTLERFAPFLFHPVRLRAWIEGFGVFAPVVFVVVQAVQVVVAPVPGQVMALVGGYVFGPFWGSVYSMVGVTIGSALAFGISSRWGRPAVEQLVHDDLIERFDGFVSRAGIPGLFVLVAIPGLPDDAICFLAGLTRFRLLTFLLVLSAGRLPAYVVTNYAGGNLAEGDLVQATVALAVVVSLSVLAYLNRDRIRRRVSRE